MLKHRVRVRVHQTLNVILVTASVTINIVIVMLRNQLVKRHVEKCHVVYCQRKIRYVRICSLAIKRNVAIFVWSDTFAMGLLILTPTQIVRVVDSVISILLCTVNRYHQHSTPTGYSPDILCQFYISQ